MRITILTVGKLKENYLKEGIESYKKRINFYIPCELIEISDVKGSKMDNITIIKNKEGEKIKSYLSSSDYIISLDEKGVEYSSISFSKHLQKLMNRGIKELTFIIGGSYGLSDEIINLSNERLSLSKMTFPHDLVRLIFIEQLYRALTIIKNEKYHH